MNYTLIINNDELLDLESISAIHADNMTVQSFVSISGENFTVDNISTNSAFSFTILVSNTIGVVSTKRRAFCEYFYLTSKI